MSILGKRIGSLVLASSFVLAATGLGLYAGGVIGGAPARAEEGATPRERHPHIRAAIRELREAKRELEKADHDFGGHRAEALKASDRAIEQLEKALKFDKE
jgi:hypothetical protein